MTYKEKITKIFDRIRPKGSSHWGEPVCWGCNCGDCPFVDFKDCTEVLAMLAEYCESQNTQKILTVISL